MIFSRLGRSLLRSGRSRLEKGVPIGANGARGALSGETILDSLRVLQATDGLGFRGYLTVPSADGNFASKPRITNWNYLVKNPKFWRLFSSDSNDKKNYENYYPKDKKEIPREREEDKSDSKGEPF